MKECLGCKEVELIEYAEPDSNYCEVCNLIAAPNMNPPKGGSGVPRLYPNRSDCETGILDHPNARKHIYSKTQYVNGTIKESQTWDRELTDLEIISKHTGVQIEKRLDPASCQIMYKMYNEETKMGKIVRVTDLESNYDPAAVQQRLIKAAQELRSKKCM